MHSWVAYKKFKYLVNCEYKTIKGNKDAVSPKNL